MRSGRFDGYFAGSLRGRKSPPGLQPSREGGVRRDVTATFQPAFPGLIATGGTFRPWQRAQTRLPQTLMQDADVTPSAFADDPDVALMERVATGDEAALTEIIERWKNPLINFFYRSLHAYPQSEDLTQMVFIRLYRAAPRYKPQARFSTFLFHIARRLLINEYRRQQRKPLEATDPADLQASTGGREELNTLEIEEAFRHALEGLPENHRTAILFFKQQEMSYQEIAEAMEASESAVKTWIFRARQHIKTQLKDLL